MIAHTYSRLNDWPLGVRRTQRAYLAAVYVRALGGMRGETAFLVGAFDMMSMLQGMGLPSAEGTPPIVFSFGARQATGHVRMEMPIELFRMMVKKKAAVADE